MKFLVPIAFLALSSSFVAADLEEQALWMIACANDSMSVGVPAATIPPHLPAVNITSRNFTVPLGLGDLHVSLSDASWAGLPFYNKPEVSGKSNGTHVFYNYSIRWPDFVVKGNFDWAITTKHFGKLAGQHAEFNVHWIDVWWRGVWNMKLPQPSPSGKGWIMPEVFDFSIISSVKDTETELSGLGLINSIVKGTLDFGANYIMNNFPVKITQLFQKVRFNGFWLNQSQPEHLEAMLAHCGLNLNFVE